MNRMCTSGGGCNVCECDENEVPKPWIVESTDTIRTVPERELFDNAFDADQYSFDETYTQFDNPDSQFSNMSLEQRQARLARKTSTKSYLQQWDAEPSIWSDAQREQMQSTATYINLVENPEGNTGYSGEEPRRIWDAIYNENCFATIGTTNVDNMCLQDRLMYRLISGLHASITAHVFKNWKLNETTYEYIHNQFLWNMMFTTQAHNNQSATDILRSDPNDITGFSPSDVKVLERINNLYFTLELLLDSLSRLYTPDGIFNPQILIVPATVDNNKAITTGLKNANTINYTTQGMSIRILQPLSFKKYPT
eukprot:UN01562